MNGVPSIFLLSGAAALLSVIGFLVVGRFFKPIDLEEHQQFLDAMLNIVGTLVSILLGLLVAAALDRYQALEDSVDSEGASLAQIFRLTVGLPHDEQVKLRKLCFDYGNGVVNDEWPKLALGQTSHEVFVTYVQLVAAISQYRPANDGESNIHNALITAVQEIGDCRRKRTLALHSKWTAQLMPMLITCSVIVLAFAYLYVRRGAMLHAILICFVAIALGGNIGLVFVLSNPFAGDWKILPRSFEFNNRLLKQIQSDPRLEKYLNPPDLDGGAAKKAREDEAQEEKKSESK